ncbi:MAG: type III-B CRISPR module RAMP protein Cmr1 [Anaerolineae bacterium]|nr:type III-B CRISPR module RAMP protein Cmr1 [Anaerolineae bacterium]
MEMELQLKTLTPLWTGGVETGRMDRIHETGIIGSLRWWFEAIVRGLGGDVCDPTSDNRCPRRRNGKDEFCSICQVFGATGQRRKFRLRLGDGEALFEDNARDIPIPSGRIHTRPRPRAGGWYLMGNSVMGDEIPLRIISLASTDASIHLRPVLSLIDRHAATGAKVSSGYGVLHFCENEQPIQVQSLSHLPDRSQPPRQHTLPDIRDFFFAKLQFQASTNNINWWQNISGIIEAWNGQVTDHGQTVNVYNRNYNLNRQQRDQARTNLQNAIGNGLLPLAPAVRNYLRFQWLPTLFRSGQVPQILERYLFGYTSRQENIASKVNVSHAYQLDNSGWEFRVWGWIPCQPPNDIRLNRHQFLRDLRATLTNAATWQWVFNGNAPVPQVVEWHSLNCDQREGLAYLKELLNLNRGGAT